MEPSQKIRILTSIEDWENIQVISNSIWNLIKEEIQNNELTKSIRRIAIIDDEFPKRIHFEYEERKPIWEWIVSNMGSVTLRPLDGKQNPILYFSLTKYSDQSFQWEDEKGNLIDPKEWRELLSKAIHNHRFFQK